MENESGYTMKHALYSQCVVAGARPPHTYVVAGSRLPHTLLQLLYVIAGARPPHTLLQLLI